MLRNLYLVLIITLPFIICYDYDIDQDAHYQPKINNKVRGLRKQCNDEEVQKIDSRNFEGYSDDKDSMAQLDLMSFLKKPSDDTFSDSLLDSNKMGYEFHKKKRGVLSKNFNLRRGYTNTIKSPKEVPQFVYIDKDNFKPYENLNNFGESIEERPAQSQNYYTRPDISYEDDIIMKGNIDMNDNPNSLNKNNNVQGRNSESKSSNIASDWAYEQKELKSNKYPKQCIENKQLHKKTPSNDVDTESNLVYKNDNMKSKKMRSPKRYKLNSLVFDGSTQRRNTLSKDIEDGSGDIFQDKKPKHGESLNKKQRNHEKKKNVKRFKFPFFSHDKADTKRNKKRKLFCGCNSKKQTVLLPPTLKPVDVTGPIKNVRLLKRSYKEKLCPICKTNFLSALKITKKRSPMIHNSRQYFKFLPKNNGVKEKDSKQSKSLDKEEDLEETEIIEQIDDEDPGDDKLEDNQNDNPNDFKRSKRDEPSFDKNKQLKDLEEV